MIRDWLLMPSRAQQRVEGGRLALSITPTEEALRVARNVAALYKFGMKPSMSRKGDCWDNAVAESFFATLKNERIDGRSYASRECLQREIHDYIENFYNPTRRHSA